MHLFHVLLAFIIPATSQAQGVPPSSECAWIWASWGQMIECNPNEVVVGTCGGGGHADCEGDSSHGLYCCKVNDQFTHDYCTVHYASYGVNMDCGVLSPGSVLIGACGAGQEKDCSGTHQQVMCCNVYNNGTQVSYNTECNWIYGGYGSQIKCAENEVATGRCGSGKNQDCSGNSHALSCCT